MQGHTGAATLQGIMVAYMAYVTGRMPPTAHFLPIGVVPPDAQTTCCAPVPSSGVRQPRPPPARCGVLCSGRPATRRPGRDRGREGARAREWGALLSLFSESPPQSRAERPRHAFLQGLPHTRTGRARGKRRPQARPGQARQRAPQGSRRGGRPSPSFLLGVTTRSVRWPRSRARRCGSRWCTESCGCRPRPCPCPSRGVHAAMAHGPPRRAAGPVLSSSCSSGRQRQARPRSGLSSAGRASGERWATAHRRLLLFYFIAAVQRMNVACSGSAMPSYFQLSLACFQRAYLRPSPALPSVHAYYS